MLKRVFDLSGGMVIATNPFLRANNELLRVINYVNYPIGSLTKRFGYTKIGSQITDNYKILGNYEFQYGTTPTRKHLVVVNGGSVNDIYVWSGSAWTAQGQSLTEGSWGQMTTFLDYLFFVNYSDASRTYNGTDWSTTTNVTGAPKAQYIENYQTRVFMGYCNDGTAYPSRVCYSSLPTAGAITWDTTKDRKSVV